MTMPTFGAQAAVSLDVLPPITRHCLGSWWRLKPRLKPIPGEPYPVEAGRNSLMASNVYRTIQSPVFQGKKVSRLLVSVNSIPWF